MQEITERQLLELTPYPVNPRSITKDKFEDLKSYCMEFSGLFCDVIRRRYAKFIGEETRWEEVTPAV